MKKQITSPKKQIDELIDVLCKLAPCIYGDKALWFEEKMLRKALKKHGVKVVNSAGEDC